MARRTTKALPPEWEIDWDIFKGMSGGYRRVKDGIRLQKDASIGIWVLWVACQAVASMESVDPPLLWADQKIPLSSTRS